MSTWGFIGRFDDDRTPWGLPVDLLMPAKTVTDPIHGDIRLTKLECLIVDSPAFQRLRHVKQLGMTLKVFPGAEHSRFTHSIGTLEAAQKILDRVFGAASGPDRRTTLLDDWRADDQLEIRWAEATVLARLTALIHDLTHVPFGHTIEDDLRVLTSHDQNVARFQRLYATLPPVVRAALEQAVTAAPIEDRCQRLFDELQAIVLDKVDDLQVASLYPFVGDVVNNTICADLMDYLVRDHYFTGLPIALGGRFMDSFYIAPRDLRSEYKERLILAVTRNGEFRIDIVTELIKYLRYRYEATERALYHKTKLAYDAMLGKLLEMVRDDWWMAQALEQHKRLRTFTGRLHDDELRERLISVAGELAATTIDEHVTDQLETMFLSFGDEGLIEHLIWTYSKLDKRDERQGGILALATRLRDRDHFRMLAHAGGAKVLPAANDKYRQFGGAGQRRDLERRAARWAGVEPAWQIVLWVPGPNMRLKLADVLIEEEGMISKLVERYEDAAIIAKRHRELWAVRVYASDEVRLAEEAREIVLARLRDDMGLPFDDVSGKPVITTRRLVAESVGAARRLGRAQIAQLEAHPVAAKGASTFQDLRTAVSEVADALFETPPTT